MLDLIVRNFSLSGLVIFIVVFGINLLFSYIIYRVGGNLGCLAFVIFFAGALFINRYVIDNVGLKALIALSPLLIGPYVGRRISKRRQNRQESSVHRYCPQCGARFDIDAIFCDRCAAPRPQVSHEATAGQPETVRIPTKSVDASEVRGRSTRTIPLGDWLSVRIAPFLARLPTRAVASLQSVHKSESVVVDASGGGDFLTIASAISSSRPQGRIVVRPGTYGENLIINQDVWIEGEGRRADVVIEGLPGAHAIELRSGNARLSGLTIRTMRTGRVDNVWGAIAVRGGRPVIQDCDLTSTAGCAVYIVGATSRPTFRNCMMRNSRGSGIYVYEMGTGTIEQCVISGNVKAGVAISDGGNPTVRDCDLRDGKDVGVYIHDQGLGTIERCTISGNSKAGVGVSEGGNPTVRECEIRDGKEAGVHIYDQGRGIFITNTFTGNAGGAWSISSDAGRVTRTGNTPNA